MRAPAFLALVPIVAGLPAPAVASPEPVAPAEHMRVDERYGRLPMAFEPNLGQTDSQVRYLARGRGYTTFVTDEEVVLALAAAPKDDAVASPPSALRLRVAGGREPVVRAGRELEGRSNYLTGEDESKWLRDVPTYAEVRWAGVYDGIDAVFYGTQSQLEYDFVVAPGADAGQIRVRFEGQQSAEIDEAGELVLRMEGGDVRQLQPVAFQQEGATQRRVAARCVLTGDGEVGFEVGDYDPSRPLVVDPALVYAKFVGGAADQLGSAMVIDASGAAYVVGYTTSTGFPTTSTAFDRVQSGGGNDAFVTKVAAAGNALTYSTYLGGAGHDFGFAIAVDSSGAAYVAGRTISTNFPTTAGAFDATFGGVADAFVTKLSAAGNTLTYSTFLGGDASDTVRAVVVDASGVAYLAGETESTNFPTTAGAFDATQNGSRDAFVTKLSAAGTTLTYSTYLGGSSADHGYAIAVDASGAAYVTGDTSSTAFPTTAGAFDVTHNGLSDVFVTKVAAAGTSLTYSTFLGGDSNDDSRAIVIDASGAAYVTGYTFSANVPTTTGAFDRTHNGNHDVFVTKVAAAGNALVYSTYLGGAGSDVAYGAVVDSSGAAYVAGYTESATFPTTGSAFDTTYAGGLDAFVTKLSSTGAALVYSTYLGGGGLDIAEAVAVDSSGAAYVAGQTASTDFPTTASAPDATFSGGLSDAFVTKLSAAGTTLTYSTYLGGESSEDSQAIAVDASGAAYVAGTTSAANFPSMGGGFDTTFGGGDLDAFVTKLGPTGSPVYSTFLGGDATDESHRIAVDASGAVYVTGFTSSTNFPTTAGAFDTTYNGGLVDAFVTKLSAAGNALTYSTYLGGNSSDSGNAIAVDASGAAYVTGYTYSANFPTTAGAFDATFDSPYGPFVTKLSAAGNALAYSTFLDADLASGDAIAVDGSGSAYVTGTSESAGLPTTAGAFDTTYNGSMDAFVTKLSASGNALAYSTYLGTTGSESGLGIAVDASGSAYVAGFTSSASFPTTAGAFDTTFGGSGDAFVTKLSGTGAGLVYSTYLGGESTEYGTDVEVDASGAAYVTGYTLSANFPTTPGAHDATLDGIADAFVTKLSTAGTTLVDSTFLGGSGTEQCFGMAVDASGAAYVVGQTTSPDFATSGLGSRDSASVFVAKLTTTATAPGADTIGIYLGSTGSWFLRNSNSPGGADVVFGFGPAGLGWIPLAGDWNGDGVDTPGLYDPSSGFFYLRNANSPGAADTFFGFGPGGLGWKPMAGDWDGDGDDTIGLYDPSSGFFYIRNANAPGGADSFFGFGPGGLGWVPIAGDWDGDGDVTIGLYDPSSGFFYLRNQNAPGGADTFFGFGPGGLGWRPVIGDWDGDGDDTIGLYDPSSGFFYIRNQNTPGGADSFFGFGPANATPLVGDWDGQ